MRLLLPALCVTLISAHATPPAAAPQGPDKLKQPFLLVVDASAKETYDDNVYTYEFGPLGNRASWVSQGMLHLGVKVDAGEAGTWTPSYTWEGNEYHQAEEESHQKHTARLEFAGKNGDWSWQGDLQQMYTDGATESPIWNGPGGLPATGAPEVRNRRRNFMLEHTAQITWRPGAWWTRAVYRGQLHDFMTDYSSVKSCQNFVDRTDFSLGLDVGRSVLKDWDLFAGIRVGEEDQALMRGSSVQYDNRYLRVLGGVQGHIFPWLKVDAEAGPDFRDFYSSLPAGEMTERTEVYYRGSLGFRLGPQDNITLSGKQYLFPSSSGYGMMREGLWDAEYRHELVSESFGGPWLACIAGFRVNEDDFFPADRRDRIFTPRLEWRTIWKHPWNLRAAYEYSWAESDVPNTPAREFDRTRISLAVAWKY